MIIGLTGTPGCGKSTVARMLAEEGARVIDADVIAHEVVEPGTEGLEEIARTFGAGMIRGDGSLDRARMGQKAFSDPEALKKLNAIVHPRVREREKELIAEYQRQGAALIVLDIPLLFEVGSQDLADATVVVTVNEPERIRRLEESRGWSREEIERRRAAQMPQDEKARLAGHVIDNSGSLEETRRQVRDLVARWKSLTEKGNRGV
ncbi:MAG: dephospho-CoA kinase [Candidatus Sumerlaeota bacterium]|nr:dephospho-CoA kinase [Candidatus Sumerlaeota bacterium]